MLDGILNIPWWGGLLIILVTTHITILSVTIYLHRCQAHRALDLHPLVSHFFRFWLWLTTGQKTSEWVAVHRKHHARTELKEDPHSPYIHGINKVLWQGAELYRDAAADPDIVSEYGHGVPNDWMERKFYGKYSYLGVSLLLIVFLILFGPIGLTFWAIQMAWIPFLAAGVINGAGHYWGYRNFESQDGSTNLTNIGVLIGGEELHNNHHAYPSSAKFSSHWWEFDIGWMYIRLLSLAGLAKIKKVAPKPVRGNGKDTLELDAVRAMVTSRLHIMADYAKQVTLPVLKYEMSHADAKYRAGLKQIRKTLIGERSRISTPQLEKLNKILHDNLQLKTVYEYQQRLKELWTRQYKSNESIRKELILWCQEAEKTGIRVLAEFAQSLRGYSLAPVYNHA
jgi:stearoyl-CoA desaturase (delta-9 desaturase)